MIAVAQPLRVENTVEVSDIGHRLALGVQWIDALSALPVAGTLVTDLEAIGSRHCPLRFDAHPRARHALRWRARLAKLLTQAAQDKLNMPPALPAADPTRFNLRCYGLRNPGASAYQTQSDPRQHVPRRLSLIPVQTAGVPTAAIDNIRLAWLWPGADYPLGANTTALRGQVRRGAALASACAVPWARAIVTGFGGVVPDFDHEQQVGWGHGDDRGELMVVLGVQAVAGGASLPALLPLRVWIFLPPVAAADPLDVLASLPLEIGNTSPLNDVLRGIEPPVGHVRQTPFDVSVKPGEVLVMNDADLLFS